MTKTATPSNDNRPAKVVKRQTQTTRVRGVRTRLVTTTRADGSVSVKVEKPEVLEIDLQIAAVRALKRLPEYAATVSDVRLGTFTLAADQNGSGRRGRNEAVKLKAAGMAAGEADLRVYMFGGVMRMIEFKGEKGKLEESQKDRFPLLRALGFEIAELQSSTEEDAAAQAVALVRGWLASPLKNAA